MITIGLIANKERKKSGSSLSHFWKTCFSCGKSMLLSSFSVMPFLSQATSHWFLASRWQQGREHVKCSIQVLLEAVQALLSVSNIWPWSATRMPNLPATATQRICATPDLKHVKETSGSNCAGVSCENQREDHSAKWKNRAETEQKHPSTQGKRCIWNVLLDKHTISQVADWLLTEEGWAKRNFPTSSWLLEMTGYLGAATFLWHWGILAQKHMSGASMMGHWTSQTVQNAAVCFHGGHQNRFCCNLRCEESYFKCGCPCCFWIRWSHPKCHRCSLQVIRNDFQNSLRACIPLPCYQLWQ